MTTFAAVYSRLATPLVLLALLGTLCACSTLRTDFVKKPSAAIAPIADTPATRYVQAEIAAHPGQSGFRLLVSNQNALMSRIVLTDQARHSIDLQYYIFANDATGRLLAQRLLAAADRGVRVRVLLDDIDIANEDDLLNALDVHPNIEVRLFNPFRYRQRSMPSKIAQFLLEGARLNRRMHNKSFIVDCMQAIVGGRNIGDAYFDVGDDVHFRDLDALAIGPVVPEIAASFDTYWNSDAVFSVRAYSGDAATRQNLAHARAALGRSARTFSESDYAQALAWELPNGPSADQRGGWLWGDARLIADSPQKADPDEDPHAAHIDHQIRGVLDAARQQALLVSPYYIPGDEGVSLLETLRGRGVDIKVLTNSLAATDEPEVLAAYARYRRRLLRAGVELYEFRPIGGTNAGSALGRSSGVSLHAKAMVVDHHEVFIGSMNFDPRSRYLNTEMGVIADSPALAAAVEQFFAHATTPQNSFQVVLEPASGVSSWRAMRWIGTVDGKTVQYSHDPDVSAWKRVEADLMRFLPIEGLL
jgi:putative cardiolipin synthase